MGLRIDLRGPCIPTTLAFSFAVQRGKWEKKGSKRRKGKEGGRGTLSRRARVRGLTFSPGAIECARRLCTGRAGSALDALDTAIDLRRVGVGEGAILIPGLNVEVEDEVVVGRETSTLR